MSQAAAPGRTRASPATLPDQPALAAQDGLVAPEALAAPDGLADRPGGMGPAAPADRAPMPRRASPADGAMPAAMPARRACVWLADPAGAALDHDAVPDAGDAAGRVPAALRR
ncbi:hypothetical protein K1W54_16490 [Micromonospora sp. CPCC 205371]|nr:hypothetical protein [Micromonospora sp. CPCC 205371]